MFSIFETGYIKGFVNLKMQALHIKVIEFSCTSTKQLFFFLHFPKASGLLLRQLRRVEHLLCCPSISGSEDLGRGADILTYRPSNCKQSDLCCSCYHHRVSCVSIWQLILSEGGKSSRRLCVPCRHPMPVISRPGLSSPPFDSKG